jgi:hypothetical protein
MYSHYMTTTSHELHFAPDRQRAAFTKNLSPMGILRQP